MASVTFIDCAIVLIGVRHDLSFGSYQELQEMIDHRGFELVTNLESGQLIAYRNPNPGMNESRTVMYIIRQGSILSNYSPYGEV